MAGANEQQAGLARLRGLLLSRAGQVLGVGPEAFWAVLISTPGTKITFVHEAGEPVAMLPEQCAPAARARPAPPGHRPCSPLELEILAGLADGQWTTTDRLAAKLERDANNELKIVLRNLAEPGVELVQTCQRRGIRLAPPADSGPCRIGSEQD